MKQDDEKELVLGNKQLISLFFVAAALCGVFFAMGYMMGRNTTKPSGSAVGTVDGQADMRPEGQRSQPEPPRDEPQQLLSSSPSTGVETHPALDTTPTAAAPPPVEAKALETRPVETRATETKPAKADRDPLPVSSPETGASYLQVAALPRPEAESMLRTMREQHLPVMMALSSKEGFYRVLVGPYHQTVQLSEAKSKLKALGFSNAFVQKQ
ncbi:MAG TPA: SPOR domain-containing protein [Bryobacteraceae bacterium]|nr:SPOR domain-containing protein [Bryobacteraceae bacterium]